METKMVKAYVAIDGTTFLEEGACQKYERQFLKEHACPRCKGAGKVYVKTIDSWDWVEDYRIGYDSICKRVPCKERVYEPCLVCEGKGYL